METTAVIASLITLSIGLGLGLGWLAGHARTSAALAASRAESRELRSSLDDARATHREYVEAHRAERATREQSEQASTRVLETLAPVLEHMRQMQDTVAKVEQSRVSQHAQLAEQIRVTRVSVEESRRAATDLAAVLRNNNSVRGAWGETQLRRLVETAGLINRVDFSLQLSVASDSGARRPDMVINLPGGKQMAVDSKVPYNAFMDAQRADLDDAARQRLRTAHAKAVRAHVDALSQKAYWTGLTTSPEFVVAFIPNDQLLNAALEIDPALMEDAFERGVVLATPTTLWGLLKTVAFTWKQEALAEDVQAVFEQGQVVYRRIVTMVDHVEKLGRSIGATVNNYNKFAGSLERGLLPAARKLSRTDLGSRVATPAEIEVSPRMLTAGDFDRDAS